MLVHLYGVSYTGHNMGTSLFNEPKESQMIHRWETKLITSLHLVIMEQELQI